MEVELRLLFTRCFINGVRNKAGGRRSEVDAAFVMCARGGINKKQLLKEIGKCIGQEILLYVLRQAQKEVNSAREMKQLANRKLASSASDACIACFSFKATKVLCVHRQVCQGCEDYFEQERCTVCPCVLFR